MNMLILKNIRSRKEIFNILLLAGRTECQPPRQQNEKLNNCCWELKYRSLNIYRHGLQKGTKVNLCKGPRDIQVNKQDALAVCNGTLYVSLPDCHKLVGTMLRPVSPQINWISKIVSFRSKFLQNLLECTLAHLSSSNPCSTSFSTHWKWIH